MQVIKTERLLLRPATLEDLATFHSILSNPQAMEFWSTPPHREVEQSRVWLQSMINIPPGEGEDFVVEHQGSVIGKAGFFRFPEIGFIFDPGAWGRGFAEEALRAVLERVFQVHRLETVEADVDPRNAASLRLLAKLSFIEIGRRQHTWLIGDQWCDSVDLRLQRR